MVDIAPNQTLFVSNLYGKLKKEDTKQWLYALFGAYGKIIDIVCMGGAKFTGQAWVVFADITAATNALRAVQGFSMGDGRPMRVQYAESKSNAVATLAGTWQQRPGAIAVHTGGKEARKGDAPAQPTETVEANSTLFIENLPEAATDVMLSVLFKQFPGFIEARTVPGRPGIAFIEYETDVQASVALSGLQGFKITPEFAMKIMYAKQ